MIAAGRARKSPKHKDSEANLRRAAIAFAEQARAFHDVAMQMRGASAALPLYYCALNLAKAELLIAGEISIGARQTHGLSHSQETASQLRSDRVAIKPAGVFASLFRLRLGHSTGVLGSAHVRLDALLARMGEIDAETALVDLPGREGLTVGMRFCAGAGRVGVHIDIGNHPAWLDSRTRSATEFKNSMVAEFHPVNKPSLPFALESLQDWSNEEDAARGVARVLARYGSVVGATIIFRPCLPIKDVTSKGVATRKLLALPDHMARYMFIYTVSSIVRYVPERIDACGDRPLRAIVDLAVDEACTCIVLDSALHMCRFQLQ